MKKIILLLFLFTFFVHADSIFNKGYTYTFQCIANSNNTSQKVSDQILSNGSYKIISMSVNGDDDNSSFECITNKDYTKSINTYTITYNLNGGTASGKTSYNINEETFTLPIPTREEYIFLGWTGSNGSTPQTTVSIPKGSIGNKTYTANWRANSYILKNSSNTSKLKIWDSRSDNATTITVTDRNVCTSNYVDLSSAQDNSVRGCLSGSTYYITSSKTG